MVKIQGLGLGPYARVVKKVTNIHVGCGQDFLTGLCLFFNIQMTMILPLTTAFATMTCIFYLGHGAKLNSDM